METDTTNRNSNRLSLNSARADSQLAQLQKCTMYHIGLNCSLRDCLQISLPILSKFKRIN